MSEMILVRDVVVERYQLGGRDSVRFATPVGAPMYHWPNMPSEEAQFTIEEVRGQRFIMPDGKEVCIGLTQKVRDTLGIPFDVYDQQQGIIEELRNEVAMLRQIINRGPRVGSPAPKPTPDLEIPGGRIVRPRPRLAQQESVIT